jgi:hypothetical protein
MWHPGGSLQDEQEEESVKPTKRKNPLYAGDSAAFNTAKSQLYLDDDGKIVHPGMAFYKALLLACRQRKLGRVNAVDVITTAVRIVEDWFVLYDFKTLRSRKPKLIDPKGWKVDKRRAINHNKNATTGGVAVVAIRPRWRKEDWGGFLTLEIDDDMFKQYVGLTELLNIAGAMYGIAVGRRRIWGIRERKEQWSDMNKGRFLAVPMFGEKK